LRGQITKTTEKYWVVFGATGYSFIIYVAKAEAQAKKQEHIVHKAEQKKAQMIVKPSANPNVIPFVSSFNGMEKDLTSHLGQIKELAKKLAEGQENSDLALQARKKLERVLEFVNFVVKFEKSAYDIIHEMASKVPKEDRTQELTDLIRDTAPRENLVKESEDE
jgi:maltooligosyltrehalose synthase